MPDQIRKLTLGEKTVRTNFNANGDSAVDRCKKDFAKLIDELDQTRRLSKEVDSQDGERAAEVARAASIAITHLETAAMYAVKALTA